ncbi:outer membrane beta-barrel protein [Croceibacterium aestuarii]|uniref:outer membrane beta-barrel protein n=1 Tax=Croceibacterium aestuarii TaxID=3064139 RepID=UPI00272DDD95|nr:outer membrane beta-barrel protein [Croceibacterium sp. D39]
MIGLKVFRGLLLASAAATSAAAAAQDQGGTLQPVATVEAKHEVNAGVEIVGGYNDNVYATRNREKDDFYFLARPFVRADLGSGADSASLRAEGEIGRYAELSSEDYNDWTLAADGRTRLSDSVSLIGGGEWRWDHENRGSPDAVSGLEPTEYRRGFGYLGLLGTKGRFSGRLAGTITRYDFSDVPTSSGTINNDDRDRLQGEIGVRAGIDLTSGTQLFAQGGYDWRDYDDAADDYGFDRNSDGVSLAAGVRGRLGRQFTAELFAGWLQRDYRDPALPDISTFDVGAVLDWTGDGGLGGSFRLDRSAEETTLPGASAYILTSGRLGLRANVNPRISAGIGLSGTHYDYVGHPRTEFVIGGDAWAKYWFDRNFYLGLAYYHDERSSDAAGYDYERNRFEVSVGAQLRPRFAADAMPLRVDSAAPGGAYAGVLLAHGTQVTGLDGPRGSNGANTADFGGFGPSAVVVAGYGVLVDALYLGIEAEASVDGPEWTHNSDRVFSMAKNHAYGFSARVGLATAHDDLIYARFGWSNADFRTSYDHAASSYSGAASRTGFGGGGGIEAPVGALSFVRAEFVVVSYDDLDITTGSGQFDNFSSLESQFRFGGGVRFGRPRATPRDGAPIDFAGPYVGVQIGHGSLVTSNQGTRSGGTALDVTRASRGGLAGIFAGFGGVFGRTYLGLEGEADISAINWNIERDPNGRIYSAQHDYSLGASARAGLLLGDAALLYGRLGMVTTRFDVPYSTSGASTRSREWRNGLRYGLGLEVGVAPRVRLRVDYTVTEYAAYDVAYGNNSDRFDHSEGLFRLGIAWRL